MRGQNICLGFRFTSCAFFLCPETLSRQNLKKYRSIWPEFLDVQQSRRSDISSQKMRPDQQNPDTRQLYLLQHRWTGCILSWTTLSSLHLHFTNFYYKLDPIASIHPCFCKSQLSLAPELLFVSPDWQLRKLEC